MTDNEIIDAARLDGFELEDACAAASGLTHGGAVTTTAGLASSRVVRRSVGWAIDSRVAPFSRERTGPQ
jgi:hypothetical protein